MPKLTTVALLSALLLAAPLPIAFAADNIVSTDAPDLTEVRAMIKAKDFATARNRLLALADKHEHADVYNLLGFSLRKLGDFKTSYTYYQKALDYDPNHKSAHEYIGELYLETNRPEKAREHHAILVKLCPSGCEEREDLEQAMQKAGVALSGH